MNGEGYNRSKWDPETLANLIRKECEVFDKTPEQLATDKLMENIAFAVDSIVWLAMYSDHERTRFDAAKYIVEQVMGRADTSGISGQSTDVFEELFNEIVEPQGA